MIVNYLKNEMGTLNVQKLCHLTWHLIIISSLQAEHIVQAKDKSCFVKFSEGFDICQPKITIKMKKMKEKESEFIQCNTPEDYKLITLSLCNLICNQVCKDFKFYGAATYKILTDQASVNTVIIFF